MFENTTHADNQPVRFFKVSLQRAFKRDGKFEHNSSFGRDDIPVAMHVLDQAWQFILETEAASTARNESRVDRSSHTTGCSLPGREQLGVGFISFPSFRMETKNETMTFGG